MVGTTLSHYRILEHLGSGGMGVVYKAEDTRLKRTVALKFLPPESTRDTHAKERFMREAQAASALQHNNICTIHDIEESEDGRMFIVMDCYEGETLEERLERQPISLDEIQNVAGQIVRGMIVAHQRGIIHRDLKPSNIFLTREGVVKIFDFGLAKLLGSQGISREGRTSGTVLYMSPEQLRGEEADTRADIWSFGVILYRMLAGRLPFSADYEQATIFKIMCESPVALSSLREGVPRELVTVSDRCLEKDRTVRVQSMPEVLELLEGATVSQLSPWEKVWKVVASKGILIGGAILLLCVVLGYFAFHRFLASPSAQESPRLAVLLFKNETRESEIDEYRPDIQNRLVNTLSRAKGVAVEDRLRLNDLIREEFSTDNPPRNTVYGFLGKRGYDYVIDGSISKSSGGGYSLSATCQRSEGTGETPVGFTRPPAPKDELAQGSEDISREVLAYLNVKVLHVKPEMAVWEKNHLYENWDAIAHLEMAYEAFTKYDNQTAKVRLEQAIRLDSTFISARVWLVPSQVDDPSAMQANLAVLGRLRSAADDFERAMIDWVVAFSRHNYGEGVRYLNQALQYDSTNHVLLSNLAGTYMDAQDTTRALAIYGRLMRDRWQFPAIYLRSVLCYLARRDIAAADEALSLWRSVDTSTTSYMLFAWLSASRASTGDSVEARNCRERFIALCDKRGLNLLEAELRLGKCYGDFVVLPAGEKRLRSELWSDQSKCGYLERRGDYILAAGDTLSALEQYESALQLKSTSNSLQYSLGALYEQRGDKARARKHYRQYLARDSTNAAARHAQQFMKQFPS